MSRPDDSLAVCDVMSLVDDHPAILTRGVDFHYGEGESRSQVLFDVGLEIGRGEIVIMTGPSGSGKTTLLTLIGALRHVQQGSVRVLGRELAGMAGRSQVLIRRAIGFIFQHHNLFSSLSALENVRMATALQPGRPDELQRRATAILERLGLADRIHYVPARLSGGQRQRVAIARALVNNPALILADEPTAALDSASGESVMSLLHELAVGETRTTVLIVTHDQRLLERADRIVSMVGGRVVSNVKPAITLRICKALARTRELAGLDSTLLARIAERMTVEHHHAGEILVREGVPGRRAYVLGRGEAEATAAGASPRQLAIGERFGRITAISGELITETVRAVSDLEVYSISQEVLQAIVATDKGLEDRLRQYYMHRKE